MNEELKYVKENSKHVKINDNKIDELINLIKETKYTYWADSYKEDLNLSEKEWILLVFIIESLNFCFWQRPKWTIEYNKELITGSNAMFYSLIKEVKNNKSFLDINYLSNLKLESFKKIFTGINSSIMPHLDKRYNNFVTTINFISHNKSFYQELFSIKSDIDLLNYITSNIDHFKDVSIYKNKEIHFYKRANLLVNDLFNVSKTINKSIKNVNHLLGCADYVVPRTFRDFGIFTYDASLSNLIDNELIIPRDSDMEIELRANTLYVIELLKERLNKEGISIPSVELDNIIWNIGRKYKKSKSHHTITIFY